MINTNLSQDIQNKPFRVFPKIKRRAFAHRFIFYLLFFQLHPEAPHIPRSSQGMYPDAGE